MGERGTEGKRCRESAGERKHGREREGGRERESDGDAVSTKDSSSAPSLRVKRLTGRSVILYWTTAECLSWQPGSLTDI